MNSHNQPGPSNGRMQNYPSTSQNAGPSNGRMQNFPLTSQNSGHSNWTSQGQQQQPPYNPQSHNPMDYYPEDRNTNYRQFVNSTRNNNQKRNPKVTPQYDYNFPFKSSKKVVTQPPKPKASLPNRLLQNPRNKGFSILCKRQEDDNVKIILNKISDELTLSLKDLKALGFKASENSESLTAFMFFNELIPYQKVQQKLDTQDGMIVENESLDSLNMVFDGPRDLAAPLAKGEIFVSVRNCETLYPIKMTKAGGVSKIVDAIGMLDEWRITRFNSDKNLIEKIVHSIYLGKNDIIVSFTDEKMRDDCHDLFQNNWYQYVVNKDTRPAVIATSQGQNLKAKKNMMRVTPDMMKFFEAMSKMTPQMITWCQMMASGRYGLVELIDDDITEQFGKVSVDDNDINMDTEGIPYKLPKVLTPIKVLQK